MAERDPLPDDIRNNLIQYARQKRVQLINMLRDSLPDVIAAGNFQSPLINHWVAGMESEEHLGALIPDVQENDPLPFYLLIGDNVAGVISRLNNDHGHENHGGRGGRRDRGGRGGRGGHGGNDDAGSPSPPPSPPQGNDGGGGGAGAGAGGAGGGGGGDGGGGDGGAGAGADDDDHHDNHDDDDDHHHDDHHGNDQGNDHHGNDHGGGGGGGGDDGGGAGGAGGGGGGGGDGGGGGGGDDDDHHDNHDDDDHHHDHHHGNDQGNDHHGNDHGGGGGGGDDDAGGGGGGGGGDDDDAGGGGGNDDDDDADEYDGWNIHGIQFSNVFNVDYIMRRCMLEFTPQQYLCMILNHERFQFAHFLEQLNVGLVCRIQGDYAAADNIRWGPRRTVLQQINEVTLQCLRSYHGYWKKSVYKIIAADLGAVGEVCLIHYTIQSTRVKCVDNIKQITDQVDNTAAKVQRVEEDMQEWVTLVTQGIELL